ncbi:MAG: LysR family transcriptional regulator [Caulobacteraceae bacterium]
MFDALLDERNVTRAGARLGHSQSAVSHALSRLRQLLDEELFVRRSSGMDPTPRALEIGPALHTALLQMQTALAPAAFDPAATERRFSISAGPYGCAVLIPPLWSSCSASMRRARPMQVTPYGAGTVEALDTGRVDAAPDWPWTRPRAGSASSGCSLRPWCGSSARDIPWPRANWTLDRLGQAPHILVEGFEDPFDAETGIGGAGAEIPQGLGTGRTASRAS